MPLLICPNDNSPMQPVQRSGVEFDMCPSCRGVWLDRGELEKLMGLEQGSARPAPSAEPARFMPMPAPPQSPAPQHRQDAWRSHDDDDDDHRRGHGKKRSSWLDIFE